MKTIEIPDNLFDKVQQLSHEYFSQNTRFTRMPVYFQVESEVRVDDVYHEHEVTYYDSEGDWAECEDNEAIKQYCEDNEIEFPENFDYGYDEIEGLVIYHYKYEKSYHGFFLTAKDCESYIELNKHNLNGKNHRSYAQYGGYKTDELSTVIELLEMFK